MAEEERREIYERLRAFAEMTSTLMYIFRIEPDGAAVPEWASDAITGYTLEEFRALPSWLDIIVEADRSIAMVRFRDLLAGRASEHEVRIVRRQGDERRLRVNVRPMWDANRARVNAICVAARDITDQERTEAALHAATTLNEQILSGAHEGILVIDREYRYRFWNPQMERITGVPRAKVLGQTPWDLFPFLRESNLHVMIERVFAGEQVTSPDFQYEVPTTKQSGWAVQKMGPLRDHLGRIYAALIFVEDITERKRTEQERDELQIKLAQAQKMEALGSLAGGVAHDFNNLLAVILALSENAIAQMPAEDPLREPLTEIRQAGVRAAALTRQLLAFSRKQVLDTRLVDLNAVVRGIEPMLKRVLGSHIELVTSLASGLGTTMADLGQMELVILNLVVNARDAMPAGGRITIETANVELDDQDAAHRSLALAGPYVCLSVTDTGSGMDEATRARCFEPFFTTKEMGKGTGLGLATTHGIVRQSGGDIDVVSRVGAGTTFKVLLPQAKGAVAREAVTPKAIAPARGETVLVVEDERAILAVITKILEGAGYDVLAASGAAEALQISRDHAGPIDLVMTDVVMPQMRGPALVEELRKQRPTISAVYMSGYADDSLTSGRGTTFVSKPFTTNELIETVRRVIDARAKT